MNRGLTDELKAGFPDTFPIVRPLVQNLPIPDPQGVAGFVDGEGCFYVKITKSNTHKLSEVVNLSFILTQHNRDNQLMRSLIEYLGCGNVYNDSETVQFVVTKYNDLTDKVIPFFDRYKIVGVKFQDYLEFKKVIELMQKKAHLTSEGLDQIRKIKAGMNRERK